MGVPAMSVNGAIPVLSPLLVLFLLLALAGALMLALALFARNIRLITQKRLNPFSPADLQKAANPDFSTREPVAGAFHRSLYARVAGLLLGFGALGVVVMLIWGLFAR